VFIFVVVQCTAPGDGTIHVVLTTFVGGHDISQAMEGSNARW